MTYKNICTKKTYESKGVEKVKWLNAGTMRITDDGKTFIELNMFPDTVFYVFDQKNRDNQTSAPKNEDENWAPEE